MATIKQIFGTETAITVTGLPSLVDGSTVSSNEIDNSVSLNQAEEVNITFSGTGVDRAIVYIQKATTTGDYGSTDVLANLTQIASIEMAAITPRKVVRVENLPKYYKYVVKNNSGADFTAGTIKTMSANLTNA